MAVKYTDKGKQKKKYGGIITPPFTQPMGITMPTFAQVWNQNVANQPATNQSWNQLANRPSSNAGMSAYAQRYARQAQAATNNAIANRFANEGNWNYEKRYEQALKYQAVPTEQPTANTAPGYGNGYGYGGYGYGGGGYGGGGGGGGGGSYTANAPRWLQDLVNWRI